jgi:hypothetical protein
LDVLKIILNSKGGNKMKSHEEREITKEEMADLNPAKLRTIEKWVDGEWVSCLMRDLRPNDPFRFTDDPSNKYVAIGKPYVNDFYVWTIEATVVRTKTITEG